MLDEQSGERPGASSNSTGDSSWFSERKGESAETAAGYGDSGGASRFFYTAKASRADREDGNGHPTVKPTDLMRWLCRLVTPPGGTVLDPFCGSGSTGVAANAEGFDFIGVERELEYVEIARRRIANVAPLFAEGGAA